MPTLTNLVLDPTGNLSANKIQNEQHSSFDSFSKIIVPVFGNYFGESLVVEDDQGLILTRGTDFACIEYNQTESLKYGKEIYSAIVVPADTLSVVISYQALGGDSSFKRQELLDIYSSINLTNPPINYTDIQNLPSMFKPEDHLHGMDTIYGFEFIVKTLVRIKNAIETTEMPAYGSLLSYVDNIIQQLKDRNEIFYENETPVYVEKFLQGLNKVYFDIENLANLSAATEIDGQRTGTKTFVPSDLTENKYGTLQSLIGLKTVLYKTLLLKQPVGLGYKERQYHLPIKESVIQSPNGATFSYVSEASAIDQGIAYDHDLYPTGSAFDTDITITKVSNGTNSRNGVITAHDQKKMQSYLGEISTGNQGKFSWKRITNTDEIDRLIKVIDSHITDYGNPHEETKFDIGLSEVENLPVVNKEDLRAIRSVHKYLTFDSLLYFMRTFLLQNGKQFAATEKDNQFIIDNCVVVYTPAGVKCKTTCDVIEPRPPTLSKISQACITGQEFILDGYESETLYTDKLLEGEYSVGTPTTILQAIKHFSQCCGYVEASGKIYVVETCATNEIIELNISQNDDSDLNIIADTYWEMTINYPSGESVRQSGIWPNDDMGIHTSGTDIGIVTLNFVFRHHAKALITKTYNVNEIITETLPKNVAHLYTDKMFIRTGETAAGELSLYLASTDVVETTLPITWRKNSTWEVVNYNWLPATLQRSNGKVSKVNFTIPFITDWDDHLVAEFVINGDTIQASPIYLKAITVNKTSKTIPLYENNIATGNITISRDNSTGIVTIENITIPSAQNTSDVYFFRTGTSNTATVGAIIDVWNDLNNDGWYYPLPPGIASDPGPNPPTTPVPTTSTTSTTLAPTTSTFPPDSTTPVVNITAALATGDITITYNATPVVTVGLTINNMVIGRTYSLTHYLGASAYGTSAETIAGMQTSVVATSSTQTFNLLLEHSDSNFKRTGINFIKIKVTDDSNSYYVFTNTVQADYLKPALTPISNVRLGIDVDKWYTGTYADYGGGSVSVIAAGLAAGETYKLSLQMKFIVGGAPWGVSPFQSVPNNQMFTATKSEDIVLYTFDQLYLPGVCGFTTLGDPTNTLPDPVDVDVRVIITHSTDNTIMAESNTVRLTITDAAPPTTTWKNVWKELNFATGQWGDLTWNTAAAACTALSAGSTSSVYPSPNLAAQQWYCCKNTAGELVKIIKRMNILYLVI